MATKNSDYWDRRSEQLEAVLNTKARSAYKELEKIFNAAIKAADKELVKWYTRFMMNEEVSLAEAKKLLKTKELEELRWTVEEYIEKGRANGISQDWEKQLENASARVHISRLEAIKLQLQNIIEQVYGQHRTIADNLMRDIYSESYYRNAFEVFQGIGIGWTFASFDENHLEKILNKPWAPDSFNFSKRIWNNKAKLVANVQKSLTQNLILGSDPQKSIDDIANKMNTSKYNAGRLIMTESAFFSGEARRECFNSLGVEQYRIVATLDMRTSEICRDMDGKVFKMSEYDPGMTAPPFHPYCRTTTAPYFADMDAFAERAARDPDSGKTYHVPANMTYNEWIQAIQDQGDEHNA